MQTANFQRTKNNTKKTEKAVYVINTFSDSLIQMKKKTS